jgi:hypothetical protein
MLTAVCEQSAAPNLASHQKSVSHEFCTPAASSFVHHAAHAGYVCYERSSGVQCEEMSN